MSPSSFQSIPLYRSCLQYRCKQLIEQEYLKYITALADEAAFPFEDVMFHSQCPSAPPPLMYPYQASTPPSRPDDWPKPPPPLNDPTLKPDHVSICYIVLVHDQSTFVKRLIDALQEPQHTFIVHVDLKANDSFVNLNTYANHQKYRNVFLVDQGRIACNWGGFTIVNATFAGMSLAWATGRHFDFMINLSGSTYPLRSNRLIRETLAMKGGNKIYSMTITTAVTPGHSPDYWNHFVECDDALHRIARLTYPRGINLYTGSQWFILPRHVMEWLLFDPLPYQFSQYARHIMVADENYFTSLLMHSPYCADLITTNNLLFLLFDKWEHENKTQSDGQKVFKPDPRKCVNPNPKICGRSPTTLTTEYRNLLQMSKMLFARKFNEDVEDSMVMVREIDEWRLQDEVVDAFGVRRTALGDARMDAAEVMLQHAEDELCLELSKHEMARMKPCNASVAAQWLTIGPCTGITGLPPVFHEGGCAIERADQEDIFCQIRAVSTRDPPLSSAKAETTARIKDTCLDISGENPNYGGSLIGWECSGQWNQLFRLLPNCTLSAVQPKVVGRVRGLEDRGDIVMCMRATIDVKTGEVGLVTAVCDESHVPGGGQVFRVVQRVGSEHTVEAQACPSGEISC